jgi:hypothetical protein
MRLPVVVPEGDELAMISNLVEQREELVHDTTTCAELDALISALHCAVT